MSTGAGAAGDNTDASATKPISVLPSARATLPRQTDPDEPARIVGSAADGTAHVSTSTAAPPASSAISTGTGLASPTRSRRYRGAVSVNAIRLAPAPIRSTLRG